MTQTRGTTAPQSTDKLSEAAFRSVCRAVGQVQRIMRPYFQRHGISGAQWGVLRALHRAENEGLRDLCLKDVGERLLVRPPSVTTVIDRLERMGLVARRASTHDLRVKRVRLTPTGRDLLKRVLKGHSDHIATLMGGLSEAEQAQLRELMLRWTECLQTLADREERRLRDKRPVPGEE